MAAARQPYGAHVFIQRMLYYIDLAVFINKQCVNLCSLIHSKGAAACTEAMHPLIHNCARHRAGRRLRRDMFI